MKKILPVFRLSLCMMFCLHVAAADTSYVRSPDGLVAFKLFPFKGGAGFSVSYRTATVIEPSEIAFSLNGRSIIQKPKIIPGKSYSVNESYPMLGAHAVGRNHSNGRTFTLNSNGFRYFLEVKIFNDGAAFRLRLPGNAVEQREAGESTVFNLPSRAILWYHDMEMHYESVHVRKMIDSVQKGEWAAPPATFRLNNGLYGAITEARLEGFSGMSLQANGQRGLVVRLAHDQPTSYPYRLRYSAEDTLRLKQPALYKGEIITPWRVVMVGKDLNTLVNSNLVLNLNPPPDKKLFPDGLSTDWIRPGRAVWKYLNGGGDGTPEVMKHFTDGAAALGFEHNILEGFWSRWTDAQLRELVEYSKQKGVGIWLWKHSKSLRHPLSRDSFFSKCHALGITGVKLDFFDHEAKEVVDLYEDILKETARYKLLVDFHGANKPTGRERTYPNEMVREAVKGMEASKLADRATHETTIPFTRWLAGPAEYTVLHFGERRKNTTWAHQIASMAILHAPLLTLAAHPDTILANPASFMITNIPATWDETIVLPPSEIGEIAVFARRKGNTWFLAVMNGNAPGKIRVPLTFLNGRYNAGVVKDDPSDPAALKIERATYDSSHVIELDLQPGGGYIARFTK